MIRCMVSIHQSLEWCAKMLSVNLGKARFVEMKMEDSNTWVVLFGYRESCGICTRVLVGFECGILSRCWNFPGKCGKGRKENDW